MSEHKEIIQPDADYVMYAENMARTYYSKEVFDHAVRVANYVSDNELIPQRFRKQCIALALMHDLLEDTDYQIGDNLGAHFKECLELLTKPKHQTYVEYIKNIRSHVVTHESAYWVKLADIKDHLSQTETLTERLRDKYVKALPFLL